MVELNSEHGFPEKKGETEPSEHEQGAATTGIPTGQDRVSATMFSEPGRCWIELVNSKIKESYLFCLANRGGETLSRACVNGLWLVNKVNCLPSNRNWKWLMAE